MCVCCVLSVGGFCIVPITRHGSPIECDLSECDCEDSIMRRPWFTSGCRGIKKILVTEGLSIMPGRTAYQNYRLGF